jgi:hypothetical protein
LPPLSTPIPLDPLNEAAVAVPSAAPTTLPARVVTNAVDVIFRIRLLFASVTNRFPLASRQIPVGLLKSEWKDGAFGGLVIALFKKAKGRWTVSRYSFGASDVPWVGWAKETGAPKSVFPPLGR